MEPKEHRLARRIVAAIEEDLNDRKGMHISSLPADIQKEIRRAWFDMTLALVLEEK